MENVPLPFLNINWRANQDNWLDIQADRHQKKVQSKSSQSGPPTKLLSWQACFCNFIRVYGKYNHSERWDYKPTYDVWGGRIVGCKLDWLIGL